MLLPSEKKFFRKILFITFLLLCLTIRAEGYFHGENCPTSRKMGVLPGRGWDNLRNKDMGQVLKMEYKLCQTTEDGFYLLPDNVFSSPIKKTEISRSSEVFSHWSSYKSVSSRSFKISVGVSVSFASIEGSFSEDYQKTKNLQISRDSITARVSVRNTRYAIHSSPVSEIHPHLKNLFTKAAEELEKKNDEKCDLMLELIVRNYGTHYVAQAEAGAVIYQEDYISRQFYQEHESEKTRFEVAVGASAKLFASVHFNFKMESSPENELMKGYSNSITASYINAIGGPIVKPNKSMLEDWLNNTATNLVIIDRFGDPLSFLITPIHFPKIRPHIVSLLRKKMEDAISRYYLYNTRMGCTNLNSTIFDITSNVDDSSCEKFSALGKSPEVIWSQYYFGGIFQVCRSILNDAGDLCEKLNQSNPLTDNYSCPLGYIEVPLVTGEINSGECEEICSGWSLFQKCYTECNMYRKSKASYNITWCAATAENHFSETPTYWFGGVYTSWKVNPLTKSKNCPTYFTSLQLGGDLKICVSNHSKAKNDHTPFGGFFSCRNGNPFATNFSKPFPKECPIGFSQHIAIIENNCRIAYCVKANAFQSSFPIGIIRPPFADISNLFVGLESPAESYTGNELTTGSIIGITVPVVLLVIVLLGNAYYFVFRKT